VLAYAELIVLMMRPTSALGGLIDQDNCHHRLESEALTGWRRLSDSMLTMTGSEQYSYEEQTANGIKPTAAAHTLRKESRTFWIQKGSEKVVVDRYDEAGKWIGRSVYCINPDYAFIAAQDTQGAPYFLKKYGTDQGVADDVRKYLATNGIYDLRMPYTAEGDVRPYSMIVASQDCHVLSCAQAGPLGADLSVTYESRPPLHRRAQSAPVKRSMVVFEPSGDWRVLSANVSTGGQTAILEIQYAPAPAPPGNMVGLTRRVTSPGGRWSDSTEISSVSFDPIPRNEFYLASVGLPEVAAPSAKAWSRFAIIGINLIVIGLILLIIYWQRRRARA
jgi:hypothetical protein